MDSPPIDPFADIKEESRFLRKVKENPIVPLGMLGFLGMAVHGAYKYKHRGNMSTSVYLMHLRVRAQSMVVGALVLGITYEVVKRYFFGKKENKST